MGDTSLIQWTDKTWNPWHGCKKVSAGCKFCYMFRDKTKYGQDGSVVLKSKTNFTQPLKWKDPALCFTCSWSDWFIEDADAWRAEAWATIKATPHITYQILTKRIERAMECLPADWGDGYPNVWLGVSVEDQDAADKRIPLLLSTPAVVRFLSCEPLLGEVQLTHIDADKAGHPTYNWINALTGDHTDMARPCPPVPKIDWVIIGGESGNDTGQWGFRPCFLAWISKLVNECKAARTPVFVKQMGTFISKHNGYRDRHGGDLDEWPEEFRVRQMPRNYKPPVKE